MFLFVAVVVVVVVTVSVVIGVFVVVVIIVVDVIGVLFVNYVVILFCCPQFLEIFPKSKHSHAATSFASDKAR